MNEEWRWIAGYEGRYEVSDWGRIRTHTFSAPILLRTYISSRGYLVADLHPRKGGQTRQVHRLVAQAFISNPTNRPFVHHKDANRANAHRSNLEWVTGSENTLYAYQSGRLISPLLKFFGERAPSSKLKEPQVLAIRAAVKRGCSVRSLTEEYGVSDHAIRDIVSRHSWKHI